MAGKVINRSNSGLELYDQKAQNNKGYKQQVHQIKR